MFCILFSFVHFCGRDVFFFAYIRHSCFVRVLQLIVLIVMTTGVAGGMHKPCKGLIPARA